MVYFPASHSIHSLDSENAAYFPETQIIHLSEPSNENLPALQGKQSAKQ